MNKTTILITGVAGFIGGHLAKRLCAENPELTVVGISLDRNEKAWRKALAEEKCTWTQAWDQKGIAAKNYAVSAIPLLILIAPDGKIIGRYQKTEIGDILKKQFKR